MFRAGGSCKRNILRTHFLLTLYWLGVHIQLQIYNVTNKHVNFVFASTQLIQILQHDTISFYSSNSSKQNPEPRGHTLVRSVRSAVWVTRCWTSLETSLVKATLHKRLCLIWSMPSDKLYKRQFTIRSTFCTIDLLEQTVFRFALLW